MQYLKRPNLSESVLSYRPRPKSGFGLRFRPRKPLESQPEAKRATIGGMALLPDGEQLDLSAADMAAQGATVDEIADKLGLSQAEAANQAGPITPAQLRRLEHVALQRGIGMGDSLPHVQAAQFMLVAHVPEQYGRAGAGQGSATLRVIVDRTWQLRAQAGQTIEGEVVPQLASQD
jgi:hypothetical protein